MPSCYKLCVVIDAVHSLCILKNFDGWSLVGVLETSCPLQKQNSKTQSQNSPSPCLPGTKGTATHVVAVRAIENSSSRGRQAGELLDDVHSFNYPTREEIVEVFFQLGIRPLVWVGMCQESPAMRQVQRPSQNATKQL